jgi:hypothetical protein
VRWGSSWDWWGCSSERSGCSWEMSASTEDWRETHRRPEMWESSWDWRAVRETSGRKWESWDCSWDWPHHGPGRECRETWLGTQGTRAVVTRQG